MASSFRSAGHLPHNSGGEPADPDALPRQRAGTTPQMHGRFPDFDVMSHRRHWDPVTRELLKRRVSEIPPYRFFDERERTTLGAFLDVLLAQDREPRIPVLAMIDAKLHAGQLDGYRYEDMPDDGETWRRVARALDGFAELDADARHRMVAEFAAGSLPAGEINVKRAWSVITRGAISAFYSHPWAFNEIGFRGPAYPRGYMRRNMGPSGTEPDEPQEAFDVDPVSDVEERS